MRNYLTISEVDILLKALPYDQAIQIMKSKLSGEPETVKIEGELIVILNQHQ